MIPDLASHPESVLTTTRVEYAFMGRNLTKADICDEIIALIDAGERVKGTTLHSVPGMLGQRAFEMKPRINDSLYYIKVVLQIPQGSNKTMLILSAHPNH